MDLRDGRPAVVASLLAAGLGLGHAAVSGYWALGGTALIDTIGGAIERAGRERGPSVIAGLWAVAALKGVVAVAAPVVAGRPSFLPRWTAGRWPRLLSWVAAVTLVAYGATFTLVGLLVQAGVVRADAEADHKALAWHAYFWDPWFLVWGAALVVSLLLSRGATTKAFTYLAETKPASDRDIGRGGGI